MKCDDVKPLMADHWANQLDGPDAVKFEAHLESCESCRSEAARLGSLWRDLELLPADEPDPALRGRFHETLRAYRQGMETRATWHVPAWQIAAMAAVLALGIGIGFFAGSGSKNSEVADLRGEVASMRQLIALSLLQQQSASERLRGVSWANRSEPSDPEVLTALVSAVNHDTNVNVRLAAVDALRAYAASPTARRAVVESLASQESPLVQVALIDLLVDLQDRNATPELRALADRTLVDDGVKQRAYWALEKLQ